MSETSAGLPLAVAVLTTEQAGAIIAGVNAEMRTMRRLMAMSALLISRAAIEERNRKLEACLDRIWELMPDKEELT